MISTRDIRLLEKACELARKSSCKKKHGAIIAKGNTILSYGKNNRRTQMRNYNFGHFECHAELDAIMRATKLEGANMYVVRVSKTGVIGNSRSCTSCIKLMRHYGIKKVFYTKNKDEYSVEKVNKMKMLHDSEGSLYLKTLK